MKIVYLDAGSIDLPAKNWSVFDNFDDFTKYSVTSNDELFQRAEYAEILITNKVPLRDKSIDKLIALKCICVIATGYDIVDIEAASSRNIPVFNVEGYGTNAVAEHVFAYILKHEKKVAEHFQSVRNGDWYNASDFAYTCSPIGDLHGKKIGILGFGKIAQQVARIAKAFDMQVVVNVRRADRFKATYPWIQFDSLDSLYANCDYISLHVPLTDHTLELIDVRAFEKMASHTVLINTARGKIISTEALRDALESEKIAAAYLDVLDQEPPYANHPLIQQKNCFITPHNAWKSQNSMNELLKRTVDNIRHYKQDKWDSAINFKNIRNK